MSKNLCGKTRKTDDPYEVWTGPRGFEWRVLKKYHFVEVGTTPYGKYGLYKEMIPVGSDSRGKHLEIAESVRMSNPDLFKNLHLRQIVSRG